MIQKMFSVYDEKAEAFVRPFFTPNEALAVRSVATAGADIDHPFGQHPGDYVLYDLGTFDETTAEVHTSVPPRRIGSVKEMLAPEDKPVADLMALKPGELKHG